MSNLLKHANYLNAVLKSPKTEVSLRFLGNKLPRSDARHVNSQTKADQNTGGALLEFPMRTAMHRKSRGAS